MSADDQPQKSPWLRKSAVWKSRDSDIWCSLTPAEYKQFPLWQLAFSHAYRGAKA
jgi:hypothetical protein